jgi:uncharacterized membrane protein YvbJ
MKARFRCDNCGHHVPLHHDTCPHCGKRFTAVVCPQCDFEGEASLFRKGCPKCGFQGDAEARNAVAVARKPRKPPLPAWFYLWSSVFLLLILVGLLLILLRSA